MEANDSGASDALQQCMYLWEEYKYRHDLIWQRIFRFTTAVVLISIIPYVQQEIARLLGAAILIAPLLATVLAGFVLIIMRNELELFGKSRKHIGGSKTYCSPMISSMTSAKRATLIAWSYGTSPVWWC